MRIFKSDQANSPADLAELRDASFPVFGNLPKPFRKAEKNEPDLVALSLDLEKRGRYAFQQIEEATRILAKYNRLSLKPDVRSALANMVLARTYPNIAGVYEKYQALENGLPENNERKATLKAAIQLVDQLAISYKHLFVEYYDRSLKKYKKNRDQACESGFRILEMLLLAQRFRALRYEKAARTDWQDINQVFFSLLYHNDIDEKISLHGMVGMRNRGKEKSANYRKEVSVKQLYVSLQLFGVLEINSWQPHLYHVIDEYLDLVISELKLLPDSGGPLRKFQLLGWLGNEKQLAFERTESVKPPAIILDFTALAARLAKDYEAIGVMKFIDAFDDKKLARPLQKLNDEDRIPVLQSVLEKLHHKTRQSKRMSVFQDNSIDIHFGVKEAGALLVERAGKDMRRLLLKCDVPLSIEPGSELAQYIRSHQKENRWQLVNFSATGVLLNSFEDEFSSQVNLGQLVVFFPSADASNPSIAYVRRINRAQDRLIEVALSLLSNYTELVIIQFSEMDGQERTLPALLIHGRDDNWQLLNITNAPLKSGTPLKLIREDGTVPARLGDAEMSKKEFSVYQLRSPALHR
jgi:hypothetical protein